MYPLMKNFRRFRGLTLIESMVLMVTLSIVAVGAGVGLQSVAGIPAAANRMAALNAALVDGLEQTRSLPAASMVSSTSTVVVSNVSYTRTITVSAADPANPETGTSTQADFRRIDVSLGGLSMRCYVFLP